MSATAPTTPAMPTPAVKNSNRISESPATNRKYATHGVLSVCASCCGEIELAEAHDLAGSCTCRFAPTPTTFVVDICTSPVAVWSVVAVEADDELEQRRVGAVDQLVGHRGLARQPVVTTDGVVASTRSRSSAATSRSPPSPTPRRIVEVDRVDRADVRARRDRRRTTAASASSAVAPCASPPDGPTHTVDRHRRLRTRAARARRCSTSTAPDASSWNTTSDDAVGRGLAQRLRDQRGVRRIDQSVDLHDVDARRYPIARCACRAVARSRPARATSPTASSTIDRRRTGAESSVGGSHRPLVACGDGGCRVLLHLPRRHRRGQGWRREDDRHGRARDRGRARRVERAHRRGRGQVGARRRCSTPRRSATTRSTSIPASGPGSSRPTPRSSTTS